jgi:hypothetical protein
VVSAGALRTMVCGGVACCLGGWRWEAREGRVAQPLKIQQLSASPILAWLVLRLVCAPAQLHRHRVAGVATMLMEPGDRDPF